MTETYRILDAAANRAGEGLRVVEDFARFGLNDAHLSRLLKECRHELGAALDTIPEASRLAARDTLGDVGTSIGTASEYQRASLADVARASFKRVQEALRTLEEYGKVVDIRAAQSSPLAPREELPKSAAIPNGPTASASNPAFVSRSETATFAQRIEQLRYRLYTAEKAVLRTQLQRERLHDRRLYLLVTASSCVADCEAVVRAAVANGVGIVQVREKSLSDRELVAHARRIREWTREADVLLIVNDRADIAVLAEADGVHVGQDELSVRDARRIVGPDRLVGVSTHTIEQARQAVLDGADYLGVGPTFSSSTKSFEALAGLDFVRQVATEITLPWFAIGGIDANNVAQVVSAGASRIAVSGAICTAVDAGRSASDLLRSLS